MADIFGWYNGVLYWENFWQKKPMVYSLYSDAFYLNIKCCRARQVGIL